MSQKLRDGLVEESQKTLNERMSVLRHCVEQLSDDQIWWRPQGSVNSIGNLILHLCGNIRQWIISGIGGTQDDRNRPAEFAERGPIPKEDLIAKLAATLSEAESVLQNANEEQLLKTRRIQGFDVTGIGAIFSCVPHFSGHTQEVILLTRMQLGETYRFRWQPTTPDEGLAE